MTPSARTADDVAQEVYALLITYQALRTAIADTALATPGMVADRGSFTVALQTARDQLVHAAGSSPARLSISSV
ncbi:MULTISPECIES: hypothetical protein [Nocardia]|uniref:hypothetical protein n=1 Tax=Nocardia TaxID=1817 RepID=UPI0007E94198|nr:MULTISPECIES: hypothetical protein [Nocardia]OBF62789.1 hypothetical protein A9X06_10600 [Mycobacterium sp. 852002-51759_SCH5129042]MBF6278698.1 hypothetical protein [Nocardia nova]OBA40339.1 hypothetical protein A5789_17580 [Nocardia sp. 852002-51101_SCH5132738]OBA41880.1 hypothetical protein A5789_00535 [Nocardia sp. 852002-51101_SCH5132738]OBA43698.1 hypothetical protein A5789_10480 [Nocardia sp. 852002-51101_SCH5132738]